MAGDGLVHGVVEHFGEEVVQRALVGAADVHARPLAHRLEAFQYLDVLGGIARRLLAPATGAGSGRGSWLSASGAAGAGLSASSKSDAWAATLLGMESG